MNSRIIRIQPTDNLVIALTDLYPGDEFELNGVALKSKSHVPAKHKFAIENIEPGAPMYMYGTIIGTATQAILKGEAVGLHNVKHAVQEVVIPDVFPTEKSTHWIPPDITDFEGITFNGYHRSDGKVGVRNYWLVVPLVFCENRNIEEIKNTLLKPLGYAREKNNYNIDKLINGFQKNLPNEDILQINILEEGGSTSDDRVFKNVDGIKFLTHEGGCGGTRQDSRALCALLAGYVNNANVAGATFLSLGCENAQVSILKEEIEKINSAFDKPVYFLGQQNSVSEGKFIEEAVKKTFTGLVEANRFERKPAPLSKLLVGLECGGSDGFSGITANPSVGYFSDLLVALGGSPVLAEFPELHGVEQDIVDRCENKQLAEKFLSLMESYNAVAESFGTGFDMNPSPGNIKDGLITDAMKSAGAARKGGTSPITDVLGYTEQITKRGLNLLCTPGNDVESTTALAGSGCTLILFTTGLGTPTGNASSPTIKISSNNALAVRMQDIIDINAGTLVEGIENIETKGREIMRFAISVASGEIEPKASLLRQEDFIPWKRSISL